MATLTGTDVYQRQTASLQAAKPPGDLVSGDIREFYAVYLTTAAEVTGDNIPIVKLPLGANLRTLKVTSEGVGGTSVVIDTVGDVGAVARYATADIALTAASAAELDMVMLPAILLTPFPIDTDANSVLRAVITGTFPMTAAKKIVFRGTYRLN